GGWHPSGTRPEFSKSITRSVHQFRGNPKRADAPVQFISGAASTKLQRPNAILRVGKFPTAHSCCSHSKVCSMKHARLGCSTRSGLTAMFPSMEKGTCRTESNHKSSVLRPAFAIAFSPATEWDRLILGDRIRI